jgi:hypothetical protein
MKRNNIYIHQYLQETKLINLVPRERRVVRELKRVTTVQEWNQFRMTAHMLLGLNESEAVSDEQIGDLLKTISKELNLPIAKKGIKDIDIDSDSLENGDEEAIQIQKEVKQKKSSLNEGGIVLTVILAAPTLLELFGKIIDWVYRKFTFSKEEAEQYKKDVEAYKSAKKNKKLPDGTPVDDDMLHKLENNLFKSKVGKGLIKAGHALHDLYVGPLRVLIAGLIWMYSGDGEKGPSMLECWKRSKKPANLIYAIIMIGIATFGAYGAIKGISSAMDAVQSVGGIEKLTTVVIDLLKGGDMTKEVLKQALEKIGITI